MVFSCSSRPFFSSLFLSSLFTFQTLPLKDHRLWLPLSVASPAKGDLDCHDRGTSVAGGVDDVQGVTSPVGVGGVEEFAAD